MDRIFDDKIISQYVGRNPKIDNPLAKAAFIENLTVSSWHYPPGTPDYEIWRGQILLNEETVDYAYSIYTPINVKYQYGTRRILEDIVRKVVIPEMSNREKAIALLKWTYNIHNEYGRKGMFAEGVRVMAGTVEELIKFGGGQCEHRSRIFVILTQIAGLPSRMGAIYSWYDVNNNYELMNGHAVTEVFIDGKWCFFDPLKCLVFENPDHGLASLWELMESAKISNGIFENQPQHIYELANKDKQEIVEYKDYYWGGPNVTAVANYFADDYYKYDFRWLWIDPEWEDQIQKKMKELRFSLFKEAGVNVKKLKFKPIWPKRKKAKK